MHDASHHAPLIIAGNGWRYIYGVYSRERKFLQKSGFIRSGSAIFSRAEHLNIVFGFSERMARSYELALVLGKALVVGYSVGVMWRIPAPENVTCEACGEGTPDY